MEFSFARRAAALALLFLCVAAVLSPVVGESEVTGRVRRVPRRPRLPPAGVLIHMARKDFDRHPEGEDKYKIYNDCLGMEFVRRKCTEEIDPELIRDQPVHLFGHGGPAICNAPLFERPELLEAASIHIYSCCSTIDGTFADPWKYIEDPDKILEKSFGKLGKVKNFFEMNDKEPGVLLRQAKADAINRFNAKQKEEALQAVEAVKAKANELLCQYVKKVKFASRMVINFISKEKALIGVCQPNPIRHEALDYHSLPLLQQEDTSANCTETKATLMREAIRITQNPEEQGTAAIIDPFNYDAKDYNMCATERFQALLTFCEAY